MRKYAFVFMISSAHQLLMKLLDAAKILPLTEPKPI